MTGKYLRNGKQVFFKQDDLAAAEHIADASSNEKAHFLVEMANAPKGPDGGPANFDYMGKADKTCSVIWRPDYVELNSFVSILRGVVAFAEDMNLRKKLFFRGKTPDGVGLKEPAFDESMGPKWGGLSEEAINVVHGIVGVITEAGEMGEILLRMIDSASGASFDAVNVIEECGDVEWYNVRALRGINATTDQRDRINIDKLNGRHGETFDAFRDAHRDLDAERERLELHAPADIEASRLEREAATLKGGDLTSGLPDAELTSPLSDPAGQPDEREHRERLDWDGPAQAAEDAYDTLTGKIDPPRYGDCEGDNPANPPRAGLTWHDGCWRFERNPAADIEGMDA